MKSLLIPFAMLMTIPAFSQVTKTKKMQVAVWDTYVTKKDGTIMHFDIIAPSDLKDTTVIYNYGKEYLRTKNQEGQPLTSRECRLCHIEAVKPQWEADIRKKGYFIYEMENCH